MLLSPITSSDVHSVLNFILKTEPIVARTVFKPYKSALPFVIYTPSKPSASAVRITVPMLPGSETPSIMTMFLSFSDGVYAPQGISTTASIPCGVSVSAMSENTLSETAYTFFAVLSSSAISCGSFSAKCSDTITKRTLSPQKHRASAAIRLPSAIKQPFSFLALFFFSDLTNFTVLLSLPVMLYNIALTSGKHLLAHFNSLLVKLKRNKYYKRLNRYKEYV